MNSAVSQDADMALILAKKELRKRIKNVLSTISHDNIVKQSNTSSLGMTKVF
jgi:hypothetical protein